jgi:hypothetical protein
MTHGTSTPRWGSYVGLTLSLLVLSGACRDSSSARPVLSSAAGEPGTPLGNGYEVAAGTTLIGDPVPGGTAYYTNNEPVIDDGWTATMVVEGRELTEIVDAYLRQAEDNGLKIVTSPRCGLDVKVTICTGFARSNSESDFTTLTVQALRGMRADVVSDHVVVQFSTLEVTWSAGERLQTSGVGAPIPDPVGWPPLPAVGDTLGTAGEVTRSVTIERGSRLAGPPRLNVNDTTGGIYAVLEVTGDPSEVLHRYVQQLTRSGLSGPSEVVETAGDAQLTKVWLDEAGGDGFKLTLVERPGRPKWLIIEGSHD